MNHLTGTARSSASKLRFVLLLSLLLCAFAQQSVRSEDGAALSGAQPAMLAYLLPRDAEFFKGLAKEAAESRVWAGIHYRSDLVAGLAQADAVAGLIIERAESDGSQ
jgi:hypothetical protein